VSLLRSCLLAALYVGLVLTGCRPESDQTLQTRVFRNARPPVELAPGDTIAAGDELYMMLSIQRPYYIYVVSEDAASVRRIIFPCSTWRGNRRLEAGQHRLPPPVLGSETFWSVTSVTPREHLLVVASARPIPLLDSTVVAESTQPCAAPVTIEASHWIDGLVGGPHRDVWVSSLDLKGIADHG
jgi:Domain of unknown function (DUF4384)